jgi:phasin family protein
MLGRPSVVAKSVKKKIAVKPVVAKPIIKAAVVAKPVVAAPVAAKVATPAPVAVAAPVAPAPTPIKTPEPVKAPIIAEGKKVMNDTVTKVQETAQKFTADATARATEMFGDVSARAKTAMEKGSKGLEEMVEFSKGNLEAVVASGRVAAKGAQDIAKYSAEYGRKSIEEANATAKKFAAVKSPTEFFALQSEVAKTNLDAMVGEASKFAEGYMKLLGEIVQPMQNRYAVAVEKVKTAVAA